MFEPEVILRTILIILAAAAVLAIILRGYVKAPPDQAYIISGLKKESKVLIGRSGIRVPFLLGIGGFAGLNNIHGLTLLAFILGGILCSNKPLNNQPQKLLTE